MKVYWNSSLRTVQRSVGGGSPADLDFAMAQSASGSANQNIGEGGGLKLWKKIEAEGAQDIPSQ